MLGISPNLLQHIISALYVLPLLRMLKPAAHYLYYKTEKYSTAVPTSRIIFVGRGVSGNSVKGFKTGNGRTQNILAHNMVVSKAYFAFMKGSMLIKKGGSLTVMQPQCYLLLASNETVEMP
jgi:hypothetical protein